LEESTLIIKTEEIDGRIVKSAFIKDERLFTVSESFTDQQIYEVFDIADKMFGDGMKLGVARVQNDIKTVLGLN